MTQLPLPVHFPSTLRSKISHILRHCVASIMSALTRFLCSVIRSFTTPHLIYLCLALPCLLLVKARQTNKLGKAEEGKPDSSLRQGKGRQRKAEEGKRQGRADENTG